MAPKKYTGCIRYFLMQARKCVMNPVRRAKTIPL
jgi:hypothetical protein